MKTNEIKQTLIERMQSMVRLYADSAVKPQAITIDFDEVHQLVDEHAALVAVAEAAKILRAQSGRSAGRDCLDEQLAKLAAAREGGAK